MQPIICNSDDFFSFSDSIITNCYLDKEFLNFEFVFCFLNNQGKPAIYSSEGYPKLIIQLKKLIRWTDLEQDRTLFSNFENHLSELVGKDFLEFSHKDGLGKILYSIGEIIFEMQHFQIIVFPTNLFLYRYLTEFEMNTLPLDRFPKTNLPVSFH
ncbi:hypothetical protein ACYSNU_00020 [Enterococcus sp. LJL120]